MSGFVESIRAVFQGPPPEPDHIDVLMNRGTKLADDLASKLNTSPALDTRLVNLDGVLISFLAGASFGAGVSLLRDGNPAENKEEETETDDGSPIKEQAQQEKEKLLLLKLQRETGIASLGYGLYALATYLVAPAFVRSAFTDVKVSQLPAIRAQYGLLDRVKIVYDLDISGTMIWLGTGISVGLASYLLSKDRETKQMSNARAAVIVAKHGFLLLSLYLVIPSTWRRLYTAGQVEIETKKN